MYFYTSQYRRKTKEMYYLAGKYILRGNSGNQMGVK